MSAAEAARRVADGLKDRWRLTYDRIESETLWAVAESWEKYAELLEADDPKEV